MLHQVDCSYAYFPVAIPGKRPFTKQQQTKALALYPLEEAVEDVSDYQGHQVLRREREAS